MAGAPEDDIDRLIREVDATLSSNRASSAARSGPAEAEVARRDTGKPPATTGQARGWRQRPRSALIAAIIAGVAVALFTAFIPLWIFNATISAGFGAFVAVFVIWTFRRQP